MARQIINGEPGTTYRNDTGKVLYQFIVSWTNSCGQCIAMDHAIGPSFPIPLHRGCRCRQVLLAPGATSQPFVDFAEKVKELDEHQRTRVVGRSNLTLIERGIVSWDDVVTRTRVRDFREVVSRKGLSVKELVSGGVPERLARQAYEAVHTPAHEIAAKQRQDLVAKVLAKGIERDDLRKALAERLASRVGIGSGPSGPGTLPIRPSTPRPPASGTTSRRISASPERMYSPVADPARQYLGSLGVKPEAIEAVVPKPAVADTTPILPGRPIAAWDEGRRRIEALRSIGSDYGRIDEAYRAAQAEVEDLIARRKALAGAEKRTLKKPLDEAEARLSGLKYERFKAQETANAQARDILSTGRRFILGADAEGLSDDQRRAMGEGLRWMQRTVAPPPGGKGDNPADPLLVKMKPVPASLPQRSFCIGGQVFVDDFLQPDTLVHEVGHWFDNNAGFAKSAREFLAHRVGDEAPRPLSEAIGKGYGRDEMGRKDRFDEAFGPKDCWYVGKPYANETSSEITSMGMEMMYKDPVGFANRDPEYATFILGLMHGPLR